MLKYLWLPCWTSWGDRLESKLTRTAWPSLVQEGRICSSVFFLLACSLLPSLTAPIRFFISFIVKSLHVGLACTNWNPQYTRWCLLGWAMLSLFCSSLFSFPCCTFTLPLSLCLSLSLFSLFLSLPYTIHGGVFVVLGNGLNSPHAADKNGPGDRQSTMPPSVPVRKEKKDVPVWTFSNCLNWVIC